MRLRHTRMSGIALLALVSYPLVYSLPFNWFRFRWGLDRGLSPMPPEVEERARAADRIAILGGHATLLAFVLVLFRSSPIETSDLGFRSGNWMSSVAFGALCSFIPLALGAAMRMSAANATRDDPEGNGPVLFWCGVVVLRALAQEFWRAFCILALIRVDLPSWMAVLATAAACASLHLTKKVARALGVACYAAVIGFLFVRTNSILTPLSMTLIASAGSLYRARRAKSDASALLPSFKCPACGHLIDRPARSPAQFACPGCGEKLEIFFAPWPGFCVAFIAALLTFWHWHLDQFWWIFFFAPLFFAYALVAAFFTAAFLPHSRQVRRERRANVLTLFPK
jgi:predicted RNA-binding Zn-ribbon protein involved in translation (DUF1610 family)